MEGLAAAGGVIAVVSLAGQIVQGCSYLRGVFDNVKTAPRDLRSLATELKIIEDLISATPYIERHSAALDFCSEKVLKLRNMVEKYGVLDGPGPQRRWGTRLAMALNAEKIAKYLNSLREAKGYLERIQDVSAQVGNLAKTSEILESVQVLHASHLDSVQIISRTEHKLGDVEAVTKQTQQALEGLAGCLARREKCATVQDVRALMQMVQDIQTLLQGNSPQSQITSLPNLTSPTFKKDEIRTDRAYNGTNIIVENSDVCKSGLNHGFENQCLDISNNCTQVNRLIDMEIRVRYHQGKAYVNAIAIADQGFENADFDTKKRMVKLLQDLRVLMWLLTHNNNFGIGPFRQRYNSQAILVLESGLFFSWSLCTLQQWLGAASTSVMRLMIEDGLFTCEYGKREQEMLLEWTRDIYMLRKSLRLSNDDISVDLISTTYASLLASIRRIWMFNFLIYQ